MFKFEMTSFVPVTYDSVNRYPLCFTQRESVVIYWSTGTALLNVESCLVQTQENIDLSQPPKYVIFFSTSSHLLVNPQAIERKKKLNPISQTTGCISNLVPYPCSRMLTLRFVNKSPENKASQHCVHKVVLGVLYAYYGCLVPVFPQGTLLREAAWDEGGRSSAPWPWKIVNLLAAGSLPPLKPLW